MATEREFRAKKGLNNNSNPIINLGVSGASLTRAGAHSLTLTTTGATNVTLPTTGTLITGVNVSQNGGPVITSWPTLNWIDGSNVTLTVTDDSENARTNITVASNSLSNSATSTQSGYFGDVFLYDDSTPSHYLQITNSANLTALRTLSINVNDASRTVSLAGNLTTANSFTTSGNFALTLTTTAATNVTLPTTGTLATLAGTETFTNKTLTTPTLSGTASGTTAGRLGYNSGVLSFGNGSAQQSVTTGTGTANRIAYWSGTNAVTSNANFLFDGTNMVVGTTTAEGRLHAYSTSAVVDATSIGVSGRSYGSVDGLQSTGVKGLADTLSTAAGLYMRLVGVHAEAKERTNGNNAGPGSTAFGLFAKVSGTASNLTKFGAYVDSLNGATAFSTVTGTNYGIVSTGGLNVLHSTTEQLRIAYDSSNYVNFTVGASGTATIDGAGTNKGFAFASGFKLGFFGATAIVQPTTGVAASTFTANSGTAVNDASTFDGYTIKQVVKALRNLGILA